MPDVSKHVALTHLTLLGWYPLHVSSMQHLGWLPLHVSSMHLPGSDVHPAQAQVRGL